MPRPCTVCGHSSRNEIDGAILARESFRGIARKYAISEDAVGRHREHVPKRLAKAAAAVDVAEGGRLLSKLARLEQRAEGLLTKAEKKGALVAGAALVRELRELLKVFGEISGELKGAGAASVEVTLDAASMERVAKTYLLTRGWHLSPPIEVKALPAGPEPVT